MSARRDSDGDLAGEDVVLIEPGELRGNEFSSQRQRVRATPGDAGDLRGVCRNGLDRVGVSRRRPSHEGSVGFKSQAVVRAGRDLGDTI